MRHRGVHVGNFYLCEKEGEKAFTNEDEAILVMFASLAATAIGNARRISGERRARVYLETLMETAPVGVLSQREKDVLRRSESQGDKQVAAELGLTVHGVRYHLRKVFAKLGVARRAEAVRRARELGLLADDS